MRDNRERFSLFQVDTFKLGTSVDYRLGLPFSVEQAKKALNSNYIVKITNFPLDKTTLIEFASNFGQLIPKYRAIGETPDDYIGDVRIRTDIRPEDRLATERDGELHPHTAKSWGLQRPRYFGLLMICPGWTDQSPGMNGESRFVRVIDAVGEMQQRLPQTFEEDFHLLAITPVEFTATHIKDDVVRMPILFQVDKQGMFGLRYKENMRAVLTRLAPPTPEGGRYIQAVERFDGVLRTAAHIEVPLNAGDLIVLDNRIVAHARNPFVPERVDASGVAITNPRQLFNIHMQPDTYGNTR